MHIHVLRSVGVTGCEVRGITGESDVATVGANRAIEGIAIALGPIARHRDALRHSRCSVVDVHLLRSVVAAGDEVGGKTFKSNVAAIRADRDELGSAVAL